MKTSYNRLAGQSVERLAALSDGIFAVAMTLLVLELHAPASEAMHSERDLQTALLALAPKLLVYLMSFLTLGIFWVGQQTQLSHLESSNRNLTWIHIGFLFAVSLIPFSTAVLGEHLEFRTAILFYWLNLLLLGVMLFSSWGYAMRAKLVREDLPAEIPKAICRRIWIGQALYALGALLCLYSTHLSVAVIFLVQLNYAIAPKFTSKN